MHMAQGPVVHPSVSEILHGARVVVVVPGIAANVGMEHPDGKGTASPPKLPDKIILESGSPVAYSVNLGYGDPILYNRQTLYSFTAKEMDTWRPHKRGPPSLKVIVIAMGYEGRDPPLGEATEFVAKPELGAQAFIRAIKEIPCDDKEVCFALYREIHNIAQCCKSGLAERLPEFRGIYASPGKGAVEVEVSRMHETKGLHFPLNPSPSGPPPV